MGYTIRKQFKFEMAHQLKDSYSAACHENLHGHSYVLELSGRQKNEWTDGQETYGQTE